MPYKSRTGFTNGVVSQLDLNEKWPKPLHSQLIWWRMMNRSFVIRVTSNALQHVITLVLHRLVAFPIVLFGKRKNRSFYLTWTVDARLSLSAFSSFPFLLIIPWRNRYREKQRPQILCSLNPQSLCLLVNSRPLSELERNARPLSLSKSVTTAFLSESPKPWTSSFRCSCQTRWLPPVAQKKREKRLKHPHQSVSSPNRPPEVLSA